MDCLQTFLHRLRNDKDGASVVEYAVLIALIIAVVIVVIAAVGMQISQGVADFNVAFEAVKSGS